MHKGEAITINRILGHHELTTLRANGMLACGATHFATMSECAFACV